MADAQPVLGLRPLVGAVGAASVRDDGITVAVWLRPLVGTVGASGRPSTTASRVTRCDPS